MVSSGASSAVGVLLAVAQVAVQCAVTELSFPQLPESAEKGSAKARVSAVLNLFLFFIFAAEFYRILYETQTNAP